RRHVVAALESEPRRIAARCRHAIDLRAAAAIGSEYDGRAVGREIRLGVDRARAREALRLTAFRAHSIDLRDAVLGQRHDQTVAVGAPRRRAVAAAKARHGTALSGTEILH